MNLRLPLDLGLQDDRTYSSGRGQRARLLSSLLALSRDVIVAPAGGAHGARDVVDGHVAVIAFDRDAMVLTSDLENIARWGVPATNIVSC